MIETITMTITQKKALIEFNQGFVNYLVTLVTPTVSIVLQFVRQELH